MWRRLPGPVAESIASLESSSRSNVAPCAGIAVSNVLEARHETAKDNMHPEFLLEHDEGVAAGHTRTHRIAQSTPQCSAEH